MKSSAISAYIRPDRLEELCVSIGMPAEVTGKVLDCARTVDYSGIGNHFSDIFLLETGERAVNAIAGAYKAAPDSFGALTALLAAAVRTHELYGEIGISETVYIDTMKGFTRFTREHLETFGFYGFDRDWWMYRCLSANLFRLGALEFEMRRCRENETIGDRARPGDAFLSVHIPSDAVMTREALDESYAHARAFFPRYFGSFDYKCIYCHSWLLSPTLKDLLPPSARILMFQSDYDIDLVDAASNDCLRWIYKRDYDELSLLPEHTTLQRNVKKLLLAGGAVGGGRGIYRGKH